MAADPAAGQRGAALPTVYPLRRKGARPERRAGSPRPRVDGRPGGRRAPPSRCSPAPPAALSSHAAVARGGVHRCRPSRRRWARCFFSSLCCCGARGCASAPSLSQLPDTAALPAHPFSTAAMSTSTDHVRSRRSRRQPCAAGPAHHPLALLLLLRCRSPPTYRLCPTARRRHHHQPALGGGLASARRRPGLAVLCRLQRAARPRRGPACPILP